MLCLFTMMDVRSAHNPISTRRQQPLSSGMAVCLCLMVDVELVLWVGVSYICVYIGDRGTTAHMPLSVLCIGMQRASAAAHKSSGSFAM